MNRHLDILPPSAFELVTMVFSIISMIIILLLQFVSFAVEQKQLLLHLDTGICVVLLSYFVYGLFSATNKKQFLKVHWIDLVASIPAVEVLRYGRIVQVLRVLRILRAADNVVLHLIKHNKSTMLASLLLVLLLVLGGSAMGVLITETGQPGANIETAGEAIWWALVTISTVGYGEFYPVTTLGRLISSVVIITGVSAFAGISGLVASSLFKPSSEVSTLPDKAQHAQHAQQPQAGVEMKDQLTHLQQEVSLLRTEIGTLTEMLTQLAESHKPQA